MKKDSTSLALTNAEVARYSRHLIMPEVGMEGQLKLKAARALCVGAGGLGSPAILYLAAAGVGTLGVVDDDAVSLSSLQRQVLHGTGEIGYPKVESAGRAVARVNPHVSFIPHAVRLTEDNADEIVGAYDMVLDGSDNFATRYLVNRVAARLQVPLVFAAIGRWEGQISVFQPWLGGACYACVFPESPEIGRAHV